MSEGAGVIRYPVERFGDTFWVAGPLVQLVNLPRPDSGTTTDGGPGE